MFNRYTLSFTLATCLVASALQAEPPAHGALQGSDNHRQAWNATTGQWVTVEAFWLHYANRNPAKYWGRSASYPPYGEVGEHDTVLIEVAGNVCLMEFFHSRWRRAQDVRRWDAAFNTHGACPDVFK